MKANRFVQIIRNLRSCATTRIKISITSGLNICQMVAETELKGVDLSHCSSLQCHIIDISFILLESKTGWS